MFPAIATIHNTREGHPCFSYRVQVTLWYITPESLTGLVDRLVDVIAPNVWQAMFRARLAVQQATQLPIHSTSWDGMGRSEQCKTPEEIATMAVLKHNHNRKLNVLQTGDCACAPEGAHI